jgi:phenylpyruvate tautomerase PptA (4-oxalocrotonate tautomerase family)
MPLVRIDYLQRRNRPNFGREVADVVYGAMRDIINVPKNDNFQLIYEHGATTLIYDPAYLGIQRSDAIVYIQITLNEGRTVDLKRALYKAIADRLHDRLEVPRRDVFIGLIEVKKENWSFGNGVAQYAQ